MGVIKALWGGATSALGGIYGYLAVGTLAAVLAATGTYKIMHNANLAGQTKAAAQTVRLVEHQAQITMNFEDQFANLHVADVVATQKRTNEVTAHVTPKDDAACHVNLGTVRVLNDATHGAVPPAAAGPDDAPSGVALSDVARNAVQNDGEYDALAHQLSALQDWIREQQKAASEK